jgi:hypothetical protein
MMKRTMVGNGELTAIAKAMGRRSVARVIALPLFVVLSAVGGGAAFADGPFGALPGTWSGNGTVALDGGTKERMQCRAQYIVKNDDNNFQQALRCSSASYKFEVNAYVDHEAGSLSGYWSEQINNVKGGVSGNVDGNHILAVLKGTGFAANLDITTQGSQQVVTLTPSADTETKVQKVSITMRKGG